MRVLCTGGRDFEEIEGEVIGGVELEEQPGQYDLGDRFLLRAEDGEKIWVNGWAGHVERMSNQGNEAVVYRR